MKGRHTPRESLLSELPAPAGAGASAGGARLSRGRRRLAALGVLLVLVGGFAAERIGESALAATTGPLAWSSPTLIDHQYPFEFPQAIDTLSCTSTSLCVGDTGSSGDVVASTDPSGTSAGDWSVLPTTLLTQSSTGYSLDGSSCVTSGSSPFCVVGADDLTDPSDEGAILTTDDPTGGASDYATESFPTTTGDEFQNPACASATVCIVAGVNLSGETTLYESDNPSSAASWTAISAFTNSTNSIAGTACPSTTLCVVAAANGTVYSSTTPTVASSWTGSADSTGLTQIDSLTCIASPSFCLAYGGGSEFATSSDPQVGDDADWSTNSSALSDFDVASDRISCFADGREEMGSFCVAGTSGNAGDPGGLIVSDNEGDLWTPETLNGYTGIPDAFNCPSSSGVGPCFIGTETGAVITGTNVDGDGTPSFSAPIGAAPGVSPLTSLACASTSLCVGADEAGNVLTETNGSPGSAGSWSAGNVDPPYALLDAVACAPASTLCVGVDRSGDLMTATNAAAGAAAWSAPTSIDDSDGHALLAVACPSTSLCVAVDQDGNVLTSTDPEGGASTWSSATVDEASLEGVTCAPGTSLCLAFDDDGDVLLSTNPAGGSGAWSTPKTIGGANVLDINAAACPSTSLCVALGEAGDSGNSFDVITTSNPTAGASATWGAPSMIDTSELSYLSCASTTLCVATDDSGGGLASSNPAGGSSAWSAATAIDASTVSSLACVPGVAQCLAGDSEGNVLVGAPPGSPACACAPPPGTSSATTNTTSTTSTTTKTTTTSTTTAPLPPPVLGEKVNVAPVSGTVLVALPAGASASAASARDDPDAADSKAKGKGKAKPKPKPKGLHFIPLTQARQIPVGSVLNTTKGVVGITAATSKKSTLYTGDFTDGIFKLLQNRKQKGLTELNLMDARSRNKVCVSAGKKASAAKSVSKSVLGLLRSKVHGSFTTRGEYSAATARGTQWSITDECAGTLTRVTRDVVSVQVFATRKTVLVRAGHSFLARAKIGKG